MKSLSRTLICSAAAAGLTFSAWGAGWPANYEGVMLQGFYWDSFTDSSWKNLESQADELSQYFRLIWVPNSGQCGGYNQMGYMPQYWFTNHNSSFGTESELRSMIATYKAKGTGIIEDVVINHRNGLTNWYDFPVETWRGTTYQIGLDGICRNDEMAYASGQPTPTGAYDTGDNFDGCRDLDHTNASVQNACKNYCKCLLEDFGYAGFRYDMVKGYNGYYTKMYNEYSGPTFSVGEYWDGQYDALASWIESTGKTSAAFDFACKYQINEAFHSGDLTKLVWKAGGTNPQPAGLIHFGYQQYAVTFIDNHDTYRDGSKFNGNVVAANAFILCSPGTPCVFLPHYQQHKAEIQKLIKVRNAVGVTNQSAVTVLRTTSDCYMAKVTGTRGNLVVKIGSAWVSPDGYADTDIVASGNDYCVWSKTDVSGGSTPDPTQSIKVYYDNSSTRWTTPHIYYWGLSKPEYPGVAMTEAFDNIWTYTCPAGTTGILFNAGDGDATKTGDFTAVDGHLYNNKADMGQYYATGDASLAMPDQLYVIGDLASTHWSTSEGVAMTKNSGARTFTASEVKLTANTDQTYCYFNLATALGSSWNIVNASNRIGAFAEGTEIALGAPTPIKIYVGGSDASSCKSWKVAPGTYDFAIDWDQRTLTISQQSADTEIIIADTDDNATAEYYNLQGVRVDTPSHGIYLLRRGSEVTKVRL